MVEADLTSVHTPASGLNMSERWLDFSVPRVMGILNVTPDSFSDGGALCTDGSPRFSVSLDKALFAVQTMVSAGVDIIDVGGESTRPGAPSVSETEELERVIPVVTAIRRNFDVLISVDTSSAAVIAASADAGANMINDVRALQRPGAIEAAAATNLAVCLMHMQGEPVFMQQAPHYTDVCAEVRAFLLARKRTCVQAGISSDRICLDPGFGFGKTLAHNYALLARLRELHVLDSPLLIGLSRKSMIGSVLGASSADRLAGSVAGAVLAAVAGAQIIRVHDVQATVDALKVFLAMRNAGQAG